MIILIHNHRFGRRLLETGKWLNSQWPRQDNHNPIPIPERPELQREYRRKGFLQLQTHRERRPENHETARHRRLFVHHGICDTPSLYPLKMYRKFLKFPDDQLQERTGHPPKDRTWLRQRLFHDGRKRKRLNRLRIKHMRRQTCRLWTPKNLFQRQWYQWVHRLVSWKWNKLHDQQTKQDDYRFDLKLWCSGSDISRFIHTFRKAHDLSQQRTDTIDLQSKQPC